MRYDIYGGKCRKEIMNYCKEEKFYGIYLDSFFKKIFANTQDTRLLKNLISIILNENIESVTILSPEIVGDKINLKRSYLDLLVELKDKTKINIEINSNPQSYTTERNLFYLYKVMGRDLTSKDKYTDFHKHIQINLNLNTKEEPVVKYYLMNKENGKILTDRLEIINIDIEKLNEICYTNGVEGQDIFTKVLGLIGAKDKEHYEIFKNEKGIVRDIMEKAQDYITDNDLVEILDYEKMRDNREEAAKELGFDNGVQNAVHVIAKNMLSKNIDAKLISEVTGLTIEQIEKLK